MKESSFLLKVFILLNNVKICQCIYLTYEHKVKTLKKKSTIYASRFDPFEAFFMVSFFHWMSAIADLEDIFQIIS